MCVFCHQVLCEVEMKRMCLAQANADLAEAAEKLEAIRKKLAVSLFTSSVLSFYSLCLSLLFLDCRVEFFYWTRIVLLFIFICPCCLCITELLL